MYDCVKLEVGFGSFSTVLRAEWDKLAPLKSRHRGKCLISAGDWLRGCGPANGSVVTALHPDSRQACLGSSPSIWNSGVTSVSRTAQNKTKKTSRILLGAWVKNCFVSKSRSPHVARFPHFILTWHIHLARERALAGWRLLWSIRRTAHKRCPFMLYIQVCVHRTKDAQICIFLCVFGPHTHRSPSLAWFSSGLTVHWIYIVCVRVR